MLPWNRVWTLNVASKVYVIYLTHKSIFRLDLMKTISTENWKIKTYAIQFLKNIIDNGV